ncbi:histone-like nucleoid-structuring protein Lsr2 [Actinosynnema sp. NPDC053489]|uniref:Lsr2 dimerization domain-containing protein n=1 Tax=Actinosynnema sp. NPDC053489 TaxID=3363916 RepID=UPI0037CA5AC2
MAVDDLDGHTGHDVRPVLFGLDGVWFEIRLGAANAARLRAALDRFVRAARRTPGAPPMPVSSTDAHVARAVRRWAREHGYRISDRGRLSAIVLDAYERAHSGRRRNRGVRATPDHPKRLGGGDGR